MCYKVYHWLTLVGTSNHDMTLVLWSFQVIMTEIWWSFQVFLKNWTTIKTNVRILGTLLINRIIFFEHSQLKSHKKSIYIFFPFPTFENFTFCRVFTWKAYVSNDELIPVPSPARGSPITIVICTWPSFHHLPHHCHSPPNNYCQLPHLSLMNGCATITLFCDTH